MGDRRRGLILAVIVSFFVCVLCLPCLGGSLWLAGKVKTGAFGPVALFSRADNTLRLFGSRPTTLDPALVQDANSARYVVEIFSGLVTLDTDLEIVPDIAERWETSKDGTVYTFFLREGVRFHDGRLLTAHDIKYSLERACSPQLGSPVAASYLGDIVGVEAMRQGQAEEIAGVKVKDDRRLEITIDAPKGYFLAKLTHSSAFAVDRANVEGPDWPNQLNGTGPFKLARVTDALIELRRNDSYYREPAQVGRVLFILRGGVPITLYENDELDIAAVGVSDIERVQDPANPLHDELVAVPSLNTQYIGFNVAKPPFDDLRVRQAFAHAVDKQKLCTVVLKGTAVPAKGILPPGLPGYSPQLVGLDYDPARARRLLAESKYGQDGLPPIVLHIGDDEGFLPSYLKALLAMWRDNLGVEVSVEGVEWPLFLQEIYEGRYQLFSLGWIADYPDPHNFLDLLFYSASSENHTGYANPEVDRLLLEARVAQDPDVRLELYRRAEQIIVQDAAWIPLWHDIDYYLIKPYVKNISLPATVVPWLKEVALEN